MPYILLAEDSATTAELFVYALEVTTSRVAVKVVYDGVEVLDFLFGNETQSGCITNSPPCLILLDLHMPRLSGFEVLERLRADEHASRLPVVFLSSSDNELDEREAYRLGANGYIKKPRGFKDACSVIAQIERDWLGAS